MLSPLPRRIATTRRRNCPPRTLPFALAIALLFPVPSAAQHFPSNEDLEVMLRYLVEDGETPGIVLGILEADGSTRIVSYGSAGRKARPLGPKSVFEIGSITKVFTGTLLADMVERGEVALDDPVSKYLPEGVTVPSRNGRQITLLDLATHRSALTRMPDNMPREPGNPYPSYAIEDMYAFLSKHQLRRDIGAEYEYSNIGAALLGHALERAAGESYETLLRKSILDPLGMHMTSTIVAGEMRAWNTQGHDEDGQVAPYRNWPHLPGMGALRSNAEDMLRFLEANVREPETRLDSVLRMAHQPRSKVDSNAAVGLGWHVRKAGSQRIVTHGGGTAGYSTLIAFDPDKRVGFVQLTNGAEFGDDVALDFLRRGPPLALQEIAVSRDILGAYAGAYQMAPGRSVVVRQETDGTLTLQVPGNVRFRLYATSDTTFFTKRAPWRFTFSRDAAGKVTTLTADLQGQVRNMARVGAEGPPPAVVAGNAALDLPLTADGQAIYSGTYTIQEGERTNEMRIFVENGQLMGQPGRQQPRRLLYQGNHEFRPERAIEQRLVFEVKNGRAEGLVLHNNGREFRLTRKL